eukprot:m.319416 g.319416  ORF g.319416 m.319416 type:complete len:135 (+) comp23149_c0_seq1:91-495(+)
MVQPVNKVKKVVKRRLKFKRHQADRFKRLSRTSWRQVRGIDSYTRRRFRGHNLIPNIGYGTARKTRHQMPDGFQKFLVHNLQELEVLLMHNRTYAAEIAHGVSVRNRKALLARAQELNVKITNPKTRVRSEEHE